jgi:hypothetical protein
MRIYVVNPKIPIAAIKIHCEMASEMRWTGIVLQFPFIWLEKERLSKSCISYCRKSAVIHSSRTMV